MRRLILPLLWLALSLACGGDTPTAPAPPPAQLVSQDGGWVNCFPTGNCQFQVSVRNTGAGCALAVTGSVRFFSSTNVQLGPTVAWTLPSSRILRPNEVGVALTSFQDGAIVTGTSTFLNEPAWTNTGC